MFTPSEIADRVRRQPFLPLRIVTSGGETFEVRHPDMILVGERDVTIGTASAADPRIYNHQTRVAILHITSLTDLPSVQKASANGPA